MAEVKYWMFADAQATPGQVSAKERRHWIEWSAEDEVTALGIVLRYWEGTELVAQILTRIFPVTITNHGGTLADFVELCEKGEDSSDTNDVVEFLTSAQWGNNILWAQYRSYQGGQ